MRRYTMVLHAFLADDGRSPLSQEKEYDHYPVIPRIGEEVITGFGTMDNNSRWQVRAVRHFTREGQPGEGVIVDLIPAHD